MLRMLLSCMAFRGRVHGFVLLHVIKLGHGSAGPSAVIAGTVGMHSAGYVPHLRVRFYTRRM